MRQTIYKHCDCLLLLLVFCTDCFKKNPGSIHSFSQLLSLEELMWCSLADVEVNKKSNMEANIELRITYFYVHSVSLLFEIDKPETTVIILQLFKY